MARIPLPDAQWLDVAPFDENAVCQQFDLTSADASITLSPGRYVCVLDSTSHAVGKFGGAASVPANGAAEIPGFVMAAGGAFTLYVTSDSTTLHALLITGGATGTLWLTRVA